MGEGKEEAYFAAACDCVEGRAALADRGLFRGTQHRETDLSILATLVFGSEAGSTRASARVRARRQGRALVAEPRDMRGGEHCDTMIMGLRLGAPCSLQPVAGGRRRSRPAPPAAMLCRPSSSRGPAGWRCKRRAKGGERRLVGRRRRPGRDVSHPAAAVMTATVTLSLPYCNAVASGYRQGRGADPQAVLS